MKRISYFGLCLGISLLAIEVIEAQELTVSSMFIDNQSTDKDGNTWGQMVPGSGKTISEKGVELEYEVMTNDSSLVIGYKYDRNSVDSLKSGESLYLFVNGLKTKHLGFFKGVVDSEGETVHGVISNNVTSSLSEKC